MRFKLISTLLLSALTLTACSYNSTSKTIESGNSSCLNYLDSKGVFGIGYTGFIEEIMLSKGVKSSTDNFTYTVDEKNKVAYYNTKELGSTSLFLSNGSVINKVGAKEIKTLQPLFKKLKYANPKWFLIEGEQIKSSSLNDPVISNYLKLIQEHKTFKKDGEQYTFTNWEGSIYKILQIDCSKGKPVKVVTRYGELTNKKALDIIRTNYIIKYNNPSLEIPQSDIINYTKMLETKEGKIFIGKPITDVAFSFVMRFIKFAAPGKRLDDNTFIKYQNYVIEMVNNDPEMNAIVLSRNGSNLDGYIPLGGLGYYYCITLDRDTGNGEIRDGKCNTRN